MSVWRRRAKRDASEAAIVKALRALGWRVDYLSAKDLPDLLISGRGVTLVAEVKTGNAKLREGQAEFAIDLARRAACGAQDGRRCGGTDTRIRRTAGESVTNLLVKVGERCEDRDAASAINTGAPLTTDAQEAPLADSDHNTTSGKSPAFQFYPNDFLSDRHVIAMSLQERGAYITLLCLCWQNPLPSDVQRIARLCGVPVTVMRKLWPALVVCFRPHPSDSELLIHPRMERERQKQADYRRRQSDKGRASGASRRLNHGSIPVDAATNHGSTGVQPSAVEPDTKSSSSISDLQSSVRTFRVNSR